MNNLVEKTLIIIKPDAVKRGLVGTIIDSFEKVGLKLMTAKMFKPSKDVIKNHYPGTPEWIKEMGEKTLSSFKQSGANVKEKMGTDDPTKLGAFVYERLIKYWSEGPIVVMVWQGPDAIQIARKLRGHTIPLLAQTGTLHSDYSFDSSTLSSSLDRVVKTFVHASGSISEAEREIEYWFPKIEFKNYEREVDDMYLK
ncbi:nucleoside-diphosphate kinase [Candidatus Roizmanbacteria bacterium CG_4_10_14_0_2_um_filter_36_35]|uniref:nucleoside-diphosphate kinase n=4 Tax=Candidatus Roizmaniibacteriota TaxID=1752723 RepID=A0A2M7U8T8_9BACT|nr:MAG: nucleoside-diphosphate kinase [Candidatus Roizmanbacteria bacterium CG_4_10_14_0_2_um_filter_36_35]PJC32679.1 MAG: nucleoside-diphosphate kinase [Candidatus Roizmanbacteria bacterium CG_4_9_14_0_2_um_filter_36_12]